MHQCNQNSSAALDLVHSENDKDKGQLLFDPLGAGTKLRCTNTGLYCLTV